MPLCYEIHSFFTWVQSLPLQSWICKDATSLSRSWELVHCSQISWNPDKKKKKKLSSTENQFWYYWKDGYSTINTMHGVARTCFFVAEWYKLCKAWSSTILQFNSVFVEITFFISRYLGVYLTWMFSKS